jgi:small subunit ribosomal protein S36
MSSGSGNSVIPRVVWAVTALHVGLLLGYSILIPALRGPDEHLHVDRARLLAVGGPDDPGLTTSGEESVSAPVLAARKSAPAYLTRSPPVATDDALPTAERPRFDDLGPEGGTDSVNGVARQPPLVHAIGAAVLTAASVLPGWPWPFDRVVALLRLVDVAVVAGVPLLAWGTARRLGCPPRSALTAAVLVLAVPQLTHVGSTVNSDGLLIALAGVLFLLGARVVTGDDSVRTAIIAGAALGAALLTSGLAVVFVPWVAAAYLLARGAAGRPTAALLRLATAAAAAIAAGGWWWVLRLATDGHLPLGLDASQIAPADGRSLSFPRALAVLATSFWGGFGWRETSLPAGAVVVATVVLAGALGVAFWRGRVRVVRLRLALFVLPTAALAGLVAVGAVVISRTGGDAFTFQGRYLLPGLVGLMVVAAVGLDQLRNRPVPALPFLALVGAMVMQVLAVAAVTGRYWAGPSAGERFRAVLAFAPWPPVLVFFAFAGILALATWALVEVGRVVRSSLPPPRRPSQPPRRPLVTT